LRTVRSDRTPVKFSKLMTKRGQVNATLRLGAFSLQASPLGHRCFGALPEGVNFPGLHKAQVMEPKETAGKELSWFKLCKRFTPFKTFKPFYEGTARDLRIGRGPRD
jgi:hypothetical protein